MIRISQIHSDIGLLNEYNNDSVLHIIHHQAFSFVSAGYHSIPRGFMRWMNSVKRFRTPIPPLSHAGGDVADDTEKASVFN